MFVCVCVCVCVLCTSVFYIMTGFVFALFWFRANNLSF